MTGIPDRARMAPADDPSWGQYARTRLEFLADRSLALDLTRAVPADALPRLREHGVGPTFAVLTACNPHGRTVDEPSNQRLTQLLHTDIAVNGQTWVPADGVSLDGGHRECGVAVSLSKEDARALARKYGQSAFFWFDSSVMWLVGAAVDSPDLQLPSVRLNLGLPAILESETTPFRRAC
jgi:hypothetical protein